MDGRDYDTSLEIEFKDKRRAPVVLDFEYDITPDEISAEIYSRFLCKLVLIVISVGLLPFMRFGRRRSLTSK